MKTFLFPVLVVFFTINLISCKQDETDALKIIDAESVEKRNYELENTLIKVSQKEWESSLEGITITEDDPTSGAVIAYHILGSGDVLMEPLYAIDGKLTVGTWGVDYVEDAGLEELTFGWCVRPQPFVIDPNKHDARCKIVYGTQSLTDNRDYYCEKDECEASCNIKMNNKKHTVWCECE